MALFGGVAFWRKGVTLEVNFEVSNMLKILPIEPPPKSCVASVKLPFPVYIPCSWRWCPGECATVVWMGHSLVGATTVLLRTEQLVQQQNPYRGVPCWVWSQEFLIVPLSSLCHRMLAEWNLLFKLTGVTVN